MFSRSIALRCALALLGVSAPPLALAAQTGSTASAGERVNRSGPRFGVTWLGGGIVDTLRTEHGIDVGAVVTQFGWQFERQFLGREGGPAAVNEVIVLVGGLEQGQFLPSASWIVGVRSPGNIEFGVGPNATPAGVGLVIAAGVTFRAGALNVPVNLAVVPGRISTRVSLLTGFNTHR